MAYVVRLSPAATRQLDALPKDIVRRVVARLRALAEHPYPAGVRKLAGADDLWRVRAGDYRVIYRVEPAPAPVPNAEPGAPPPLPVVMVVRVAHRGEVYRDL